MIDLVPAPDRADTVSAAVLFAPCPSSRHADSWAAYGRFIFASVQKRVTRRVHVSDDGMLCHFRRRPFHFDASLLYAYQDCQSRSDSIWDTATRALQTLTGRERVDHLNVFVPGEVRPEDASGGQLRSVLDDEFVGMAFPYATHDILEFPDGFESFLRSLGHSNRRHLKARRKSALESGIRFEFNADYEAVSHREREALGLRSSPAPYEIDVLDAWDGYARSQPGFYQCTLRGPDGQLLSCSTGFFERDTAVMMYQLNDVNQNQLGLSMALRGWLIEHCASAGIKRMVLPMGVGGHLSHAASTNPVAQVLFVRRSMPALAKALLLGLLVPKSHAARMVAAPEFFARMLHRSGSKVRTDVNMAVDPTCTAELR